MIHQYFAKQTKQDIRYEAILAPLDQFPQSLDEFFSDPLAQGANVTAPFKEEAYQWVQELTPRAKFSGAVNTIKRLANGQFLGDNTDGVGLVNDLIHQGVELNNARILLLGAGGAARGVLVSLIGQQISQLFIYNRTESKASDLASTIADQRVTALTKSALTDHEYDLIINSTSAGLSGTLPDVSTSIFQACQAVYDMNYKNSVTDFNQWALENKVAHCFDGLGMLIGQAAESFYLWRGKRPETDQLRAQLRAQL